MRRFTPHDLRSTMKSHMRALGVPRDISEMCLNHKLSGVEGIYDRHMYFDERKGAAVRLPRNRSFTGGRVDWPPPGGGEDRPATAPPNVELSLPTHSSHLISGIRSGEAVIRC